MESWGFYVVRDHKGKQQRVDFCQRLKKIIAEEGLATSLPMVKYEVGRRQEYYLGNAINKYSQISEANSIAEAKKILQRSGIKVFMSDNLISTEEINSLLNGSFDSESLTTPIKYEPNCSDQKITCEEILSIADMDSLETIKQTKDESSVWEKLLYWCSAQGSGDLGRLRQTCQILGISTEYGGTWSILRKMTTLGNLEFNMNQNLRWSVVEPVIVQTPNNSYFIAGQRSPAFLEFLDNHFNLKKEFPTTGPPTIYLNNIDDLNNLESFNGQKLKNIGCASLDLMHLLPDIDVWKNMLPVWNEKDFGRYKIKQYSSESNAFENCNFSITNPDQGLYQFSIDGRKDIIAYYYATTKRWISGDFYGLRFLARQNDGVCNAQYDKKDQSLIISANDRIPMPYERVLVLANGVLPERLRKSASQDFLKYTGISEDIAKNILSLLKMNLGGC